MSLGFHNLTKSLRFALGGAVTCCKHGVGHLSERSKERSHDRQIMMIVFKTRRRNLLDDFFPHIYIYWTTQAMKTRARNDGGNKIKQPNESLQRGKRAPACSILCSTFSTQNNNEKTVKRDYCRTHMFLTKLQVYTHTQRTAW